MKEWQLGKSGGLRSLSYERRECLRKLSLSAKLVYSILRTDACLDQDEIVRRTLLPKQTVRYVLEKLECADLVTEVNGVRNA